MKLPLRRPIVVVCENYRDAVVFLQDKQQEGAIREVNRMNMTFIDTAGQEYILFYNLENALALASYDIAGFVYTKLFYERHKNVIETLMQLVIRSIRHEDGLIPPEAARVIGLNYEQTTRPTKEASSTG